MQKDNRFSFFNLLQLSVYVLAALLPLEIIALSLSDSNMVRVLNYGIFATGLLSVILSFVIDRVITKNDALLIVQIFFLICCVLLRQVGREGIFSAIGYLLMLSVWFVGKRVQVTPRMRKFLWYVAIIQGLILLAAYFGPNAYQSYQEYVLVSKELTLGFSNPNQTAIVLYATIAILLTLREDNASKIISFLSFFLIISLSYLLFLTDARTTILCFFVTMAFFFLSKTRRNGLRKEYGWLVSLIVLFPIFFFVLYMYFFEMGQFSTAMLMGKKLFSGRQRVYNAALLNWTNMWMGNMESFSFSNTHNGYLTVLVNCGIIGFVLYLIYTMREVKAINRRYYMENRSPISVVVLLSFFIMAGAESAILTGGTIYYIIMLLTVLLCNQ